MKNLLHLAIPPITNPQLLDAIERVRRKESVESAMREALDILNAKFESKHFRTYILFWRMFETDPNKLWERSGFLHCTQQNFLFRVLMVCSGKLSDEQITAGYSLVWHISPHQYLKVHLPAQAGLKEKTIAIDPWNYHFGAVMGKYASGFGTKSL